MKINIATLALSLIAGTAVAQPVLVASNTTINPGDALISGVPLATAEITVRGATLTINGEHTIASLIVEASSPTQAGFVTHSVQNTYTDSSGATASGAALTVTGDCIIRGVVGTLPASSINVSGRGFVAGFGPGSNAISGGSQSGASHAGRGGVGAARESSPCYGSYHLPRELGSGSPKDCNSGATGGGAFMLTVGGTLTVDGSIKANGDTPPSCAAGGSSGGSLLISANTLAGSGTISANGSMSARSDAGGGGGGRIALYYATDVFTGSVEAFGGVDPTANNARRGGAGTIWIKPVSSSGTLVIDNNGNSGETTDLSGNFELTGDVAISGGAQLGHFVGDAGLHVEVSGSMTIGANSGVNLTGRGFGPGQGPGSIAISASGQSGASHAGRGGAGAARESAPSYGSYLEPVDFGSGSPRDCNLGATGGGAIRMSIGGTLTNDGAIVASGGTKGAGCASGGSAGGSIWVEAASLAGSGSFIANGASSNRSDSGGGGGGRIAVYYGSSLFTGSFQAFGGVDPTLSAVRRAGAGTVWLKPQLAPGTLYIDNNSNQGDTTDFSGAVDIVGDLSVTGSGQIGHYVGDAGLHLTITGDVMIGANSGVNLVGRGYGAGQGPGSNVNSSSGQGGAGHGGRGGNGSVLKGGVCVGSVEMPVDFGSGSPRDCAVGAFGGGAIRLSVGQTLTNDGVINASGGTKGSGCASGGAAGGSIIIETSTYAGSGSVQANGAVSNRNDSGGGGGGRIALYYDNFTSTGSIVAAGGNNDGVFNSVRRGGAGTIWIQPAGDLATLVVDNDGIAGQRTEFSGERMFAANLIVADAGSISHPPEQSGCHLIFAGDVTVSSGGEINVEGRGFPAGQGPGSDFANAGGRPGAGHGGRGGDGSTGEGYGSYGSADLPTDLGSGSPRDCNGGSSGGGAIRITSAGDMTIDGLIKADGELTTVCGAGGASGGSILLEAQRILGAGEISSDGSRSARSDAGGGGGGRISMLSNENLFTGAVHAYGGTANATNPSAVRRAGAGTVWIQTASSRATLIIDNNGNRHQTTEFAGPVSFDADLIVRAGGVLSHPYQTSGTSLSFTGDVTVENGGAISVTGRGYRAGQGPGTNALNSGGQGGAGYGGAGGRGSAILGSAAYGSSTSPLELGSGAGVDCGNSGGSGGGALLLNVDGTLQVDGEISANGGTRGAACGSSGSSGGSLWINAGALTGSGVITANGAPGNRSDAGGGGGGRIAIYSCAVSLPLANITAAGGIGYASGSNGTIYFGSGTISVINQPDNTSFQSTQTIELTVEAVTSQPASSLTYQWRRRQPFGEYVPLIEGQDGRFFGVTTDTLSIVGIECTDGGYYDCIISDSCGFFPTTGAFVAIRGLADYDESGSVDGDDIIAFFADWDMGDADADLTGDGGVDGDDVIFFFSRWDQSC